MGLLFIFFVLRFAKKINFMKISKIFHLFVISLFFASCSQDFEYCLFIK